MKLRFPMLVLLLAACFTTHAQAQTPRPPTVKTAFVIDAASIAKNNVVWAGITYTIPEHWHIYWQNPGDSGIATVMQWTLPAGITAGDIVWPTPERIEEGGLVMYGYRNQVTLPVPLMPARDHVSGELSVTTNWLVCKDICIPESATFKAILPTVTPNAASLLKDAVSKSPIQKADSAYVQTGDKIILTITTKDMLASLVTKALFLPSDDGIITNTDPQVLSINQEQNAIKLTMQRGNITLPKEWHGVLLLTRGSDTASYQITAKHGNSISNLPPRKEEDRSVLLILALAWLGGLILNVMPCVLPILALKALALAKKAEASRAAAARQGMAYTAGVIVSFLLIASLMLALKATGAAIGWGFQLQHSGFVAFLLVIMLLVAANLLGLFEMPVLFGTRASTVDDEKLSGSFLTGVLAVLVATPCTAPFMATAVGATLALPILQALLVFTALGLGMASPFLLISIWPAARRLLPKPGKWMLHFKQILAAPMLLTALWLGWVLMQLNQSVVTPMDVVHMSYMPAALQQLRDEGKPVLVDVTAAWCLSCKVNERVAFKPDAMQQFFKDKHVTLMVADWTSSSQEITSYLAGFSRNGVPLYVYYPPHAAPIILPQILTPSIVRNIISVDGNS